MGSAESSLNIMAMNAQADAHVEQADSSQHQGLGFSSGLSSWRSAPDIATLYANDATRGG